MSGTGKESFLQDVIYRSVGISALTLAFVYLFMHVVFINLKIRKCDVDMIIINAIMAALVKKGNSIINCF